MFFAYFKAYLASFKNIIFYAAIGCCAVFFSDSAHAFVLFRKSRPYVTPQFLLDDIFFEEKLLIKHQQLQPKHNAYYPLLMINKKIQVNGQFQNAEKVSFILDKKYYALESVIFSNLFVHVYGGVYDSLLNDKNPNHCTLAIILGDFTSQPFYFSLGNYRLPFGAYASALPYNLITSKVRQLGYIKHVDAISLSFGYYHFFHSIGEFSCQLFSGVFSSYYGAHLHLKKTLAIAKIYLGMSYINNLFFMQSLLSSGFNFKEGTPTTTIYDVFDTLKTQVEKVSDQSAISGLNVYSAFEKGPLHWQSEVITTLDINKKNIFAFKTELSCRFRLFKQESSVIFVYEKSGGETTLFSNEPNAFFAIKTGLMRYVSAWLGINLYTFSHTSHIDTSRSKIEKKPSGFFQIAFQH